MNTKLIRSFRVIFLFIFCSYFALAQNFISQTGSKSVAKSNAAIADENVWALQTNPAALVYTKKIEAGVSYYNYYGFSDIINTQIAASYNSKSGAYGLGYILNGNEYLKNSITSIGYAKRISLHNSIGVKFNYFSEHQNESGLYKSNVFPEFAYLSKPLPEFAYGVHISNPFAIYSQDIHIDSYYKIGATYIPSSKFQVSALVAKQESQNIELHIGSEISIVDSLRFQVGFSNTLNSLSCGLEYNFDHIGINYATQLHSFLGFSHVVSFRIFRN